MGHPIIEFPQTLIPSTGKVHHLFEGGVWYQIGSFFSIYSRHLYLRESEAAAVAEDASQ
jgi:hypothetical protein